jgi:nickel/cobalt exporter
MSSVFLDTLAASSLGVAFFHAALPTHWLPFVLAAHGQNWGHAKALTVTAAAGLGHTMFTTALSVLLLWVGLETQRLTGDVFPFIAGSVLALFGAYYVFRQFRRGGHGHHHYHWLRQVHHQDDHGPGHTHETASRSGVSDAAVILSLLGLLTLSPCVGFLPVYLSRVAYDGSGFLIVSAVLALTTLAGMVLITWLNLPGLEHVRFSTLERYESSILGALLILLGAAIIVFDR